MNLFELNEIARYPGGEECLGVEAMRRCGAASCPCLEAAGGRRTARRYERQLRALVHDLGG